MGRYWVRGRGRDRVRARVRVRFKVVLRNVVVVKRNFHLHQTDTKKS